LPSSHALAARGWMQPNLVDHSGYVTSHTYTPSSRFGDEGKERLHYWFGNLLQRMVGHKYYRKSLAATGFKQVSPPSPSLTGPGKLSMYGCTRMSSSTSCRQTLSISEGHRATVWVDPGRQIYCTVVISSYWSTRNIALK
jgi:hypothetical protein